MRTVLIMALKDLVLVTRDWLGLFFIVGFPILMGVFFGSMYGGVGDRGSTKLDIAVVDQDGSQMSAKFIESVVDTGSVSVQKLSRDEALDRVRRGQLIGMICIPSGFGKTAGMMWIESPAIELGVDPSRQAEAGMLQGFIMQAAGKLVMDRFQDPASMRSLIQDARDKIGSDADLPSEKRPLLNQMLMSLDGFMAKWQDVQTADHETAPGEGKKSPVTGNTFEIARIKTIDVTREPAQGSRESLFQQIHSKWDISFPQAMQWGVLACAATFAISIVRERKQGTLLRLQAAPISRTQVLLGKATACFLAVMGVIVMMVALGMFLGMRPRSPVLLAGASVCVAFCFVGIMTLMSVVGKTEEAVSGAAWGANIIMAMFGGGMIPLAFMPRFMATLSQASPVKWSVLALEGAIWRGFTPIEMLLPCGVLIAVGAVCLAVGSIRLAASAG
jgi:ABC-2 type transport system permease protein